ERVEPAGVDLETGERRVGDDTVDLDSARDSREIAHAFQQAAGNARRAARALRDLAGAVVRQTQAQHTRAARDDLHQLLRLVEREPDRNAETIAQRRGEKTG